MLLSLKNSYNEQEVTCIDDEIYEALEGYLSGAVSFIGSVDKKTAQKRAEEYVKQSDTSLFVENKDIAMHHVSFKGVELDYERNSFSAKEKINYAVDGYATEQSGKSTSKMIDVAVLSTATLALASVVANDPSVLGAGAVAGLATGTLVNFTKMALREASAPKNEIQEMRTKDYADLRHAQLALKQLKKMIEAPEKEAQKAKDKELVNRCFASGMGNPGGMIATLKGKNGR